MSNIRTFQEVQQELAKKVAKASEMEIELEELHNEISRLRKEMLKFAHVK